MLWMVALLVTAFATGLCMGLAVIVWLNMEEDGE